MQNKVRFLVVGIFSCVLCMACLQSSSELKSFELILPDIVQGAPRYNHKGTVRMLPASCIDTNMYVTMLCKV